MRKLDSVVTPRIAKLPAGRLALAAFLFAGLASCGKANPKVETVQLLSPAENIAASSKGARAIATSDAEHFPIPYLNDGTEEAWGAAEGLNDVYAAVMLPKPQAMQELRIWLFSPEQRSHLRDIRVITADSEGPNGPNWRFLRSRLSQGEPFSEKLTVPPLGDKTVVRIEIDRSDPNWGPHKIWGFGCFTESHGDARNYVPVGTGVYIRELQMK